MHAQQRRNDTAKGYQQTPREVRRYMEAHPGWEASMVQFIWSKGFQKHDRCTAVVSYPQIQAHLAKHGHHVPCLRTLGRAVRRLMAAHLADTVSKVNQLEGRVILSLAYWAKKGLDLYRFLTGRPKPEGVSEGVSEGNHLENASAARAARQGVRGVSEGVSDLNREPLSQRAAAPAALSKEDRDAMLAASRQRMGIHAFKAN